MTKLRSWPEMEAALLPLSSAQREALKSSLERHGVLEPVRILPDGRIIDGHHRWQIAGEDVPVKVVELDDEEAFALGLELNTARRQMTPEQWREARKPLQQFAARRRAEGVSQQQVADEIGVNRSTLSRWEDGISDVQSHNANIPDLRVSVPRQVHPEIVQRITAGEPQQQVAADLGITQGRVSQIVTQHQAAQRKPEPAVTPDMPTGSYRCIVIDPPWPMQKIQREQRPKQGSALDYDTRTLEEIAALPIRDLADPDGCHIYLWVTHKFLPAGLDLLGEWGVRYQCLMTWVKNVGITPFSWMYDTEHVLFGRIGSLDLLRNGLRLAFSAKVQGHSVKPDEFYERARQASPERRLEMFAREPHEGFEPWGNEVALAS